MSWVKRIVACGRRLLRHEQAERELEAEVESYFEILVDRLVAQGLSHEEAVRRARLQLEGPEQVKEKVRQARLGFVLELRRAMFDMRGGHCCAARALRQLRC